MPDTPEQYLAELGEPRREEVTRLHDLIARDGARAQAARPPSAVLAYGRYRYRYATGRKRGRVVPHRTGEPQAIHLRVRRRAD